MKPLVAETHEAHANQHNWLRPAINLLRSAWNL